MKQKQGKRSNLVHEENEGNEEIVVGNQNYSNGKELNVDQTFFMTEIIFEFLSTNGKGLIIL